MADPATTSIPLSVLDLAPVGRGSSPAEALRNSIELVQEVERLGYRRHWVAEHHNMPGIASSSPAVLLAHLAVVTDTIRVGSGGVMLPNHAPLVIAEQFGMLEALHPGRIDLGIGRAPGTDPLTAQRLRRASRRSARRLPRAARRAARLLHRARSRRATPTRTSTRCPRGATDPAMWLLGSSELQRPRGRAAGSAVLVRPPLRAGDTDAALAPTARRSGRRRSWPSPT